MSSGIVSQEYEDVDSNDECVHSDPLEPVSQETSHLQINHPDSLQVDSKHQDPIEVDSQHPEPVPLEAQDPKPKEFDSLKDTTLSYPQYPDPLQSKSVLPEPLKLEPLQSDLVPLDPDLSKPLELDHEQPGQQQQGQGQTDHLQLDPAELDPEPQDQSYPNQTDYPRSDLRQSESYQSKPTESNMKPAGKLVSLMELEFPKEIFTPPKREGFPAALIEMAERHRNSAMTKAEAAKPVGRGRRGGSTNAFGRSDSGGKRRNGNRRSEEPFPVVKGFEKRPRFEEEFRGKPANNKKLYFRRSDDAKEFPPKAAVPARGSLPPLLVHMEELITPLCHMPMEAQLAKKESMVLSFLGTLREEIVTANSAANTWFLHHESKFSKCYLDLKPIVLSPLTEGYRNKCDFVIGINPVDESLTIGFCIEKGTSLVGPIDHLCHISPRMKVIVRELELCLRESRLPPFDILSGKGHWMELTIRLTKSGQVMLIMAFHPQNMNRLQLRDVKDRLAAFFQTGIGRSCDVTTLFFNERTNWDSGDLDLLFGPPFIDEDLLGKHFRIAPMTFFPINTVAAEKMCLAIRSLVNLNPITTLLDLCCGIGTIGLSLAEHVGQVVGLDILDDAIDSALQNALKNKITNCEFFPGSAEEHLIKLFSRIAFTEVVCVLDPPRGGVGPKAIGNIRKNSAISKLVFVTCDPRSVLKNFADLCRPPSHTFKGDPFIPIRAVPVDLFPHTNNLAMLLLFTRVRMADLMKPDTISVESYKPGCVPTGASAYPEPNLTDMSNPGPDLSWKAVPGESTEVPGLSKDQVAWLDQMTDVYGSEFDRAGWVESFKQQNIDATAAAAAAAAASGETPVAVVPLVGTPGGAPSAADHNGAWTPHPQWWANQGAYTYQYPQAPGMMPAPGPMQPAPVAVPPPGMMYPQGGSGAWATYPTYPYIQRTQAQPSTYPPPNPGFPPGQPQPYYPTSQPAAPYPPSHPSWAPPLPKEPPPK